VRAELIDAARPARHAIRDGWSVDETYVKVAGRWTYLYRAIDQHGQVIDVPHSSETKTAGDIIPRATGRSRTSFTHH
jgi:transposase, IS6 family